MYLEVPGMRYLYVYGVVAGQLGLFDGFLIRRRHEARLERVVLGAVVCFFCLYVLKRGRMKGSRRWVKSRQCVGTDA
jgi:hypothetical protein